MLVSCPYQPQSFNAATFLIEGLVVSSRLWRLCLWWDIITNIEVKRMDKPAEGLTKVATSRYEELVWAHQSQVDDIHMSGVFLPWHRYYTHLLSRMIREECGYTAPFPWWDETKDAGNFTNSGLFTSEYFGSLPEVTQEGHGSCVTDGVS